MNTVAAIAGQKMPKADSEIMWAAIKKPERLRFPGTSREQVRAALTAAFGAFPIRLNSGEQLMILRGMIAAAGEGAEPYRELMQALSQFGNIELTEA